MAIEKVIIILDDEENLEENILRAIDWGRRTKESMNISGRENMVLVFAKRAAHYAREAMKLNALLERDRLH